MNIISSIILVYKFGLIGVAIGTLLAMTYRTAAYIVFLSKNVIFLNVKRQIIRYLITISIYVSGIYLGSRFPIETKSYMSWALYAGVIFILACIYTVLLNLIFDRSNTLNAIKYFLKRKNKKQS